MIPIAAGAAPAREAGRQGEDAFVDARAKPPGPSLTSSADELEDALSCARGVRAERDPVLLIPGAGGDPDLAFSAGLLRVLRAHGYGVCAVTLPDAAMGDIQIQAEFVVAAIRSMARRSGRQVSVVGLSQGGMLFRWALKWWPDVRSLVGDVVGVAPDNHGIAPRLVALCSVVCPPATLQQLPGSRFLTALNSGDETPGRLSYSVISSATDRNVPSMSSSLRGEADDSNTRLQVVCPRRMVDHGFMGYDAVAVALVVDALRRAGPARASRVPKTICAEKYAREIDPEQVERQVAAGDAHFAANFGRAGLTPTEPAPKRYATLPAPRPRAALEIRVRPLPGGRFALRLRATGSIGRQSWPLPNAHIEVAGRRVETNRSGRATLALRLDRPGPTRARLLAPGLPPATASVRAHVAHGR